MKWWTHLFSKRPAFQNLRLHQRLQIDIPAVLKGPQGKEILGRVCDLGSASCKLELSGCVPPSQEATFELLPGLDLPGNNHHRGRVCWSRQQGARTYLGLDELTPESCLARLYDRFSRPHRPCQAIDRRRFIRYKVDGLPLTLENLTTGAEVQAECLNLSLEGCRLKMHKGLVREGNFLRLKLGPPPGWFGVTVVGQVIRSQGQEVALRLRGGTDRRFISLLNRLSASCEPLETAKLEVPWLELANQANESKMREDSLVHSLHSVSSQEPLGPPQHSGGKRCPSLWSARHLKPQFPKLQ